MANEEQVAVLDRNPKNAAQVRGSQPQLAGISALQDAYVADDWNAIHSFLEAKPQLASLLREAMPHIRRVFGASIVVHLNLVPDYEDSRIFLLFGDIQTQDSALTAFEKMNRFESEWWLDAAEKAEGLLHFSVEFA